MPLMGGDAQGSAGVRTADAETLGDARAGLFALRQLCPLALDRLCLDTVPAEQVSRVSQAAGALIEAVSPILAREGDGYCVGQIVGVAESLHRGC